MNTQNLDFSALAFGIFISALGLIPISIELSGTVIYFMLYPETLWTWHGVAMFLGIGTLILTTSLLFGVAGYKVCRLQMEKRLTHALCVS